jgi:Na+/alanine symporter
MNGLMAIPNLIGLLLLAKIVKQETARYFSRPRPHESPAVITKSEGE